jgi:short-subunit dehydrogenase
MREKVSKLPKGIWLTSEQVAKLAVDAVEAGRPRIVTGRANRVIAGLSKYLPDRLAGALIGSRSKDFRDAD